MANYKFKCTTAGTTLFLGNEKIKFTNSNDNTECGFFYTKSDRIANLLRKSPKYGKYIFEEQKTDAPAEEEKVVTAVYDDVSKTQDAITILKEKHGVTDAMRTRAELLAAADRLGISFPKISK